MSRPKLPDKNFKWTSKLAYVIGLITTDGNLSKNGRQIEFSSKDRGLVELFRRCLHLTNKIGRKSSGICSEKKYYRIQFGNVVFYRWLLRIGLTPRKTEIIGSLQIPKEYFPDFLRGHLDGDGSVTTYEDRWNTFKNPKYVYTRLWTRFRSVSKIHTEWLQKRIKEILGISGHLCEEKRKNRANNMWTLKFAKKDSMKLLSWIYYKPGVPCLERKRRIAEKFIKNKS